MARLFKRADDLPKRSLWQRIKDIALTDVAVLVRKGAKEGSLEQIEELLLEADFGVPTTLRLVEEVDRLAQRGKIKSHDEFLEALRQGVESALRAGNSDASLRLSATAPTVILVVGVNGAGKTTFIGKLAARFRAQGKRVLVGAGDTFRAGATDQLRVWAERAGADFVGGTLPTGQVQFANVRSLPLDELDVPAGLEWHVIVDFPFDERGKGPEDDRRRLDEYAKRRHTLTSKDEPRGTPWTTAYTDTGRELSSGTTATIGLCRHPNLLSPRRALR